ncbi:hypothetical protein HN51_036250, partial [Arachis hypogaea]
NFIKLRDLLHKCFLRRSFSAAISSINASLPLTRSVAQLFEHLKKYLSTRHELDGEFTRSLIHRIEDNSKASSRGMINIIISVSKIFDIFSLQRELADKIAAAGFLVVVPDLLYEKCDYFSGDWVPNPFRQFYTNETCSDIKSHQNCLKNGRPDREFLYWRWDPRGYELPLFDAGKFLNMMHGKVWALIGDSISRNHVQLLICILSTLMFLGRGSNIVNPASWKRIKHISPMGSAHNRSSSESSSFESPDFDHTAIEEFVADRNPLTANVDRNSR